MTRFTKHSPHLGDYELLLFVSPENRCLCGLGDTDAIGTIRQTWIIEFEDYDRAQPCDIEEPDKVAIAQYKVNREKMFGWSKAKSEHTQRRVRHLNLLQPFDLCLGSPTPFSLPLVVDISCAPRGHLLALLNYLERCQRDFSQRVLLMNSSVQNYSNDESDFNYGIQDIAVVPGFNGQIRQRQDLLIVIMGFEGNRAYALHRRLLPRKTFLILGDTKGHRRDFFIDQARLNNHSLLKIHGNEEILLPSRDLEAFSSQFNIFLHEQIKPLSNKFNIYLTCLGTKAQTVGTFLALHEHKYIQVLDALPTRRRIAAGKLKEVRFADFGNDLLLKPIASRS